MRYIWRGQLWADRAHPGRTVRVRVMAGGYVWCVVVTNSAVTQRHVDDPALCGRDMRGSETRILARVLLARFRPLPEDEATS